ncbi:hypothetical protein P170DRAFT_472797 [Aspergillus steynii IBT 23096]|uniref:Uncharacterized protein n=1 Tax=Aspergillus steynii IBT 23096 TaxID=1392250 RepID=A0A2I2GJ63_9EURO|nr:uncharacterized protein P170DRAFT_472797 [Aspergillus steynii IBT 23096]PLB52908.1 hypothetical protein P170DRAFT_472797 [Aspergillus steynii IBT 23096]
MMFATPSPMHQHQQSSFTSPPSAATAASPFTPVRPSPLSPRRASTTSRPLTMTTTSPTSPSPSQFQFQFQFQFQPHQNQDPSATTPTANASATANSQWSPSLVPSPQPQHPSPSQSYAHRYATKISNPLAHQPRSYTASSSPTARSTRRNAFLNRIKRERDAGRFDSRGEQLALMEHVAEEKRWGEAMRRRAEGLSEGLDVVDVDVDGEVDGGLGEDHGLSIEDELALDEYLRQEDAAQMGPWGPDLAAAPGQGNGYGAGSKDAGSFSDEEYDDIFMDLAQPSQDMDMSG